MEKDQEKGSKQQEEEQSEMLKMTGKWKLRPSSSKSETRQNRSLSISSSQEWSFNWNISKSQPTSRSSSPSPLYRQDGARSKSFSSDAVPASVNSTRFAPYSPKESRHSSPRTSLKARSSSQNNTDDLQTRDITYQQQGATIPNSTGNFENVNLHVMQTMLPSQTEEQKLIENLTSKFLTFKLPSDLNRPM